MKYFKLAEFEKAGLKVIDSDSTRNIENLVRKFLDPIREYWGGPVYLLEASGYGTRVTFTTKKKDGNENCFKYLTSSGWDWDEAKVNGDYDSITLTVFPENRGIIEEPAGGYMSDWLCCLDSGHGKDVAGKRSPDGTLLEWEWAREIKQRLQKKLEGARVCPCFDVNPEDTEPGLTTRATRANKAWQENGKKGILVSIHINAAGNNGQWANARGWSVWVGPTASSNSKELAKDLYEEAEKAGLKGNRSVPKEKFWVGNFTILTKSSMPAVLTENLFQDNKEDVEYLKSEKGKETITNILFDGIKKFLEKKK